MRDCEQLVGREKCAVEPRSLTNIKKAKHLTEKDDI